jgi:hypothetical protein
VAGRRLAREDLDLGAAARCRMDRRAFLRVVQGEAAAEAARCSGDED